MRGLLVPIFLLTASPAMAEWHTAHRLNAVVIYTAAVGDPHGPMLSIQCDRRQLSTTVYWRQPMAGSNVQSLSYRLDGSAWVREQWQLSTTHDALGQWDWRAVPLTRRLLEAKQLSIRAITRRGTAVEAKFNVAGLNNAISPIAKACPASARGLQRRGVTVAASTCDFLCRLRAFKNDTLGM